MPRTRKGAARRQSKRRLFKRAKGFVGGRSRLLRTAKETIVRAEANATRDRRRRARDFRRLWITRIGAGCRARGISYSKFIHGLAGAQVTVNRKLLAAIAVDDPKAFDALVAAARESQAD